MSLGLDPHPPIDSTGLALEPLPKTHPWRRYFARRVDYFAFAIFVTLALELAGHSLQFENRGLEILFEVCIVLSWIPCEAALLAYTGTTPGKWLFGIVLRTSAGARLSPAEALRRSAWVAAVGAGFGIGLISLVCCWRAWNELDATGATTWDGPEGYVVTHRGPQWWPLGITAVILALLLALLYVNGVWIIPFLDQLRPAAPAGSSEG